MIYCDNNRKVAFNNTLMVHYITQIILSSFSCTNNCGLWCLVVLRRKIGYKQFSSWSYNKERILRIGNNGRGNCCFSLLVKESVQRFRERPINRSAVYGKMGGLKWGIIRHTVWIKEIMSFETHQTEILGCVKSLLWFLQQLIYCRLLKVCRSFTLSHEYK